jgi:ankyrin repeat protein
MNFMSPRASFFLRLRRRLVWASALLMLAFHGTGALAADGATAKSSEADKALFEASETGDVAEMRRLLDAGGDPAARFRQGMQAIHGAALKGSVDGVRLLLARGVRPDVRTDADLQPLIFAALGGSVATYKVLAEAGARADAPNRMRVTPLHAAASDGGAEMVRYLVSQKLDLEAGDEDGERPLAFAAAHRNVESVKALLAAGARADARRKDDGSQPLHEALRSPGTEAEAAASAEIVRLLLAAGAPADADIGDHDRALFWAIASENPAAARLLLAHGAKAVGPGRDGKTPLAKAAFGDQGGIITALLAAGARPELEVRDKDGMTPLLVAAYRGKSKAELALIAGGARVDAADPAGEQALHHLLSPQAAEVVKALVAKGADIRALDAKGLQPIHRAASRRGDVVAALLAAGASPSAPTPDGALPVQLAAAGDGGVWAMLELVLGGADVRAVNRQGLQAIHVAAASGQGSKVKYLYFAGADPYARTPAGDDVFALMRKAGDAAAASLQEQIAVQKKERPDLKAAALIEAVENHDDFLVSMFLSHGYSPDLADAEGYTALHHALRKESLAVAKLLVAGGANLDARSRTGPPLCTAVAYGFVEGATFLLEKRSDPGMLCDEDSGPMSTAVYAGNAAELVTLLLKHGFPPGAMRPGALAPLQMRSSDPIPVAKLLIAAGAEVNEVHVWTPLIAAIEAKNAALVKLLLASGADPSLKDRRGQRPIDHAVDKRIPEITAMVEGASAGAERAYAQLAREREERRQEIRDATGRIAPERLDYRCDAILAGLPTDFGSSSAERRVDTVARSFDACADAFLARAPGITVAEVVPVYRIMNASERELADLQLSSSMSGARNNIDYGKRRIAEARAGVDEALDDARQEARDAALRQEQAEADRKADTQAALANAQFLGNWAGQMQAATNQATAGTRRNQMSEADKAEFQARIAGQQEDPDSQYNRDKRAGEDRAAAHKADEDRLRRERREADARRDQQRVAQANTDNAAKDAADVGERARQAAETARKEAAEKARREAQERDRVRLEGERREREAARKAEEERRAAEAARKAETQAQERQAREAKDGYLLAMTRGIKLAARTCPDGRGKHYIVGTRPGIKPEAVGCIDVQYRAVCVGAREGVQGSVHNFVGASTDCFFGDAAEISPTPSCKVAQVSVQVTSVTACYK